MEQDLEEIWIRIRQTLRGREREREIQRRRNSPARLFLLTFRPFIVLFRSILFFLSSLVSFQSFWFQFVFGFFSFPSFRPRIDMKPCLLLERPRVSVLSVSRREGKESCARKRTTMTCSASVLASTSTFHSPSLKKKAGVSRNSPIGVDLRLSRCGRLTLRKRGGQNMSPKASLVDFSQLADNAIFQNLSAILLSFSEGTANTLPWPFSGVLSALALDLSNLFSGIVTRQSVIHGLVSVGKT